VINGERRGYVLGVWLPKEDERKHYRDEADKRVSKRQRVTFLAPPNPGY
jgi:hypothetical protein